jgi:predicted PurR-regulated permease PerM
MKWTIPSLLIPQEALLPLLVFAGILTIVGLKRLAGGLIVFVLAMAFSPMFEPIVEAMVATLPDWALVLLVVVFALMVLRALAALLIGPNAADQMVGTLAADVVRFFLLLPFRGFRALLRFLITGGN